MTVQLNQFQAILTSLVSVIIIGRFNVINGPSRAKAMHRTILVGSLLMMFFLFSAPVSAAPVSNTEAASLMGNCMLTDDHRMVPMKVEGRAKCCSKSLGYCIYCPANLPRKCVKTAIFSPRDQDWNKIPPPNSGVVVKRRPPSPNVHDSRTPPPRATQRTTDHRMPPPRATQIAADQRPQPPQATPGWTDNKGETGGAKTAVK